MNKEKMKKEQEIKAKMSEKAYLQRQLSHKKDLMGTIKFSTKFMLISMTIAFPIFLLFTILAFSWFMVVMSVVFGALFLGSWIWLFVWIFYKKPKFLSEIAQIEQKLYNFNRERTDKYQLVAEKLKQQEAEMSKEKL